MVSINDILINVHTWIEHEEGLKKSTGCDRKSGEGRIGIIRRDDGRYSRNILISFEMNENATFIQQGNPPL
jgi:hypothetical protein